MNCPKCNQPMENRRMGDVAMKGLQKTLPL
jgi:hypothetical protein